MNNTTLRNIAVVAGILLFVPAFVISPGLSILLAIILVGGIILAQRVIGTSEVRLKKDSVGDVLNRMWIPVRDELSEVVRTGGSVTSATSVWSNVPNLYKQETPATFHQGMERYVNQRAEVAALVASVTATEESRQQQEIGQQDLLHMSRELLEEAKKVISFIPGSETAVRRAEASRPRPSAQQTRAAATRPSATSRVGTRQPSAASRTTQSQTATPARAVSARPASASMRSGVETPSRPSVSRPPSRPAPTPQSVTDTPTPLEPGVAPSVPRPTSTPLRITDTPEPEPAVAPSAPREPEPTPEPVVAAPAPSVSAPAARPSEPPDDLRLDVASVCEELFNSDMMSYATNRLFDERYKGATVRWKGTARRAGTYSYDFNFGDGGGTKAELDVYEVKQQYGSRAVKAFVQLPVEAADDIGARIGEEIEFEGRLMTCEGSARRLYVADARMVD